MAAPIIPLPRRLRPAGPSAFLPIEGAAGRPHIRIRVRRFGPMTMLWIHLPGQDPVPLDEEGSGVTLGRSEGNDVVIRDGSVSRRHARLAWEEGRPRLRDLGSRNGIRVNGHRVAGSEPVAPGDDIRIGNVRLRLESERTPSVRILEDGPAGVARGTALRMRVEQIRGFRTGSLAVTQRWREALAIVHELSLELLGQEPVDLMLWALLDRLVAFLRPWRGAVLLRDDRGALVQVGARSSSQGRAFQVALSRTMVEAALERREAMLVNNLMEDPRLGKAPSLLDSGVMSLMTVPLEHQDEVVGLIYLDADASRPPFTEEDLQFAASLGHLAAARIQTARLAEAAARTRDLERELDLARQIQLRLLPDRMPEVAGYDLFGANEACRRVSGDLFGHWIRPDGRLWLALADVSGKGLGPGLLMATFQAYLQAWSESFEDPAALALKLSQALARKTTLNRFITACLLLLDPRTGGVTCTNAGHNPPLLLRADGRLERLEPQGFPLALFAGSPYGRTELELAPGDLLACYTDGLTEAMDAEGREFGPEGLEAVLRAHRDRSLGELHGALEAALARHTGDAPLADDRTILLLRRRS